MATEYIYGIHAVTTALAVNAETVSTIYCMKKVQGTENARIKALADQAHELGIRIIWLEKTAFDKQLAIEGVHQGIAAEVTELKQYNEDKLTQILTDKASPFLLVLDGVTDPHNLGACLRSADAAGIDAVIVPKDRSVSMNATVRKVACGAAEVIPVIPVTNLNRTLKDLQSKGVWITGMAGEATQSVYESDFKGACCIVMGAEGSGMRRLTKETCDFLAFIPMAGTVSSLNVSVATGVTLFEAVRQRSQ